MPAERGGRWLISEKVIRGGAMIAAIGIGELLRLAVVVVDVCGGRRRLLPSINLFPDMGTGVTLNSRSYGKMSGSGELMEVPKFADSVSGAEPLYLTGT